MSSVMFVVLVFLVTSVIFTAAIFCFQAGRRPLGIIGIVASIVMGVAGLYLLNNVANFSTETVCTRRPFYERKLVNLRSSKDIYGEGDFSSQDSLFLHTTDGEFSFGSYDTFQYAYRDGSGATRFDSIAVKDVAIYDNLTEGKSPYIVAEQIFGTRHDRYTFGKIGFVRIKDEGRVTELGEVGMTYTIYVPPGTITEYLDFG